MGLVSFGDYLIPESNIETIHHHRRRENEWAWSVHVKDRETAITYLDAPCLVSVTPNTSGVRLLLVCLLNDPADGSTSHCVRERPIVGWRTEVSVESDSSINEPTAIVPDLICASNETWCYHDPASGEYWNGDFAVSERQTAIECMLEDLRAELARKTAKLKAIP